MILGLGPVVRYELITTARRGRFYLARMVYGLALLFLLLSQFREFDASHPAGGTPEQLQTFAEGTFIQFAGAQGAAILCLIPALVAGVIADEHQRKTLHYLLASQLSSAEIVLGKLGARLVHIGTFLALGIPVVCLLALYGGLNPENVYYVYLGTFTIVLFVSGLSVLVSIMARRPRDAILIAYSLEFLCLLFPAWLGKHQDNLGGALWWVGPVNDWVLMVNPFFVWARATRQVYVFTATGMRPTWFMSDFTGAFYWMVGLQSVLGLAFVALSVFGLRPMRGSSWPGAQPQAGWWSRLTARSRTLASFRATASVTKNPLLITPPDRAPCGDDPMIWKERHTAMGGGLRWLGGRPMVLFFNVLLGCFLFDVAYPVVVSAVTGTGRGGSRREIGDALRGVSMALAALGALGVAASAAVSLTGEREQDTWISLATTLLTPAEVVHAKQLGAVWSARRVGVALLLMWAVGLLLGALHPLGVLVSLAYLTLIAWLIAALGVFASSLARTSTRALAITFIMLLIFSTISLWPSVLWTMLFGYQGPSGSWSQPFFSRNGFSAAFATLIGLTPIFAVQFTVGAALTLGARLRLKATWGQ
jgi:ABC-type transport system involved in multi-copper enzyme maturation permease subunit